MNFAHPTTEDVSIAQRLGIPCTHQSDARDAAYMNTLTVQGRAGLGTPTQLMYWNAQIGRAGMARTQYSEEFEPDVLGEPAC